jgi:hypothetical protein
MRDQLAKLSRMLLAAALANGFPTELWTLARIAKLIERSFARGAC